MSEHVMEQIGDYRLIRKLGTGTFADVFEAEDIHSALRVAVKLYRQPITITSVQEQFMREAQVATSLEHPHIVKVFDYGVEQEKPYLVMSYAPNGSLDTLHPQGTILPLSTIVSYVNQISDALQYAHSVKRVIHRDIKPANVLVGEREKLLVTDFGVAEFVHNTLTWVQQKPAGTSLYMAPEQRQGEARQASDQYSLGIMVYQWLCGDPPFQGSVHILHSHHAYTPPPPLREKIRISSAVETVVLKALEKDPLQRFPTVRDFAHALEQAYIGEIITQLNSPEYAAKLLGQEHVQHMLLDYVIQDPVWYNGTGRVAINRLRAQTDAQSSTELAPLLSTFAKTAISRMEVVIQRGEESSFDRLLDLVYSAIPPSTDPSVWLFLLESLSNPQALTFVINHWGRYAWLLRQWGSISPLPDNELIRPWFPREWTEFWRFLELPLPEEWHDIALNDLLYTTSATQLLSPMMRHIEAEYDPLLESYLDRPFRSRYQQDVAVRLFAKLVESGYTKKKDLLHIMLTSNIGSNDTKNYVARVLAVAQLTEEEIPIFLERYGETIHTYYVLQVVLGYATKYLLTFTANDLDRPSARQLLLFMSTNSYHRLPQEIQAQAQDWQTISAFIDQPEINKRGLLALVRAINQLQPAVRSALVNKLIAPLVSGIQSEVDLMCVIYAMNIVLDEPELRHYLYRMAERVGENYRENRSVASLVPYIRIALQAEVVFEDVSNSEQQEFMSKFLRTLLQQADKKTLKKLNSIIQNWPTKLSARWLITRPGTI